VEAHYRFVKEECLPGMKALGVPVTAGWCLVIGTGPRTLAECTAKGIFDIAKQSIPQDSDIWFAH
jgi:hypothetical protein